jgi:hypothetical protein
VGRTAEEKEKVEVAVLQARAAYDAHPPPPPPPLAMEMLSEEEMATAIRRSEEDTVDTARTSGSSTNWRRRGRND